MGRNPNGRSPKYVSMLCGAAGLLAFVGAGILAQTPASATSPNLYVAIGGHDSGNACRLQTHPCATISYALTQAPAGAVISVGAGTFTQPLHITQSVNITGTVQSGVVATVINPSSTVSDTDAQNFEGLTSVDALVDVTSGGPATTANLANLVINGNTYGPTITSCSPNNFVGLYYHNASGSVTNVTVKGIELPTGLFGDQCGDAVYVVTDAGSNPAHVSFSGSTVKLYDKNGITCRYLNTVCNVTSSVIKGIGATNLIAQNGIELAFGGPSGSITNSTITNNSYTGGGAGNSGSGILIYDAAATTVTGNTLTGNDVNVSASADPGAVSGAWSISGNSAGAATDNISAGAGGPVEGNEYGDGIQIFTVDGTTNPTTVNNNTTNGDYEYGISVFGSSHISVHNNTTNANYDGIYVDSASGANTFTSNLAKHDLHYDYEDASTGGGTAGTANTWTSDACLPPLDSNPEGLC